MSSPSSEGSPSKQMHAGDRFISARTVQNEPFNNFDTKSEIFSHSALVNIMDKPGMNNNMMLGGSHHRSF